MTERKRMLGGHELSQTQLDHLKKTLEDFEEIGEVSNDMRALIEQEWPHLLAKLRPAKRH